MLRSLLALPEKPPETGLFKGNDIAAVAGILGDALMAYGGLQPQFASRVAAKEEAEAAQEYDREKFNALPKSYQRMLKDACANANQNMLARYDAHNAKALKQLTKKIDAARVAGVSAAASTVVAATGVWPAFWLLGNGKWPDTGEIDIMEYVGEPDWIGVALHGPGYSGETPLVNKYFFEPGTDVTDWHEYEVDWDSQRLLFKVDGRLIYRVTRPMVERYGKPAGCIPVSGRPAERAAVASVTFEIAVTIKPQSHP